MVEFEIMGRKIGPKYAPLVIAEIGINHEGSLDKAIRMVDDAKAADCECVKFQYHVIEDEMIPNNVIPGNAKESIWDIMSRCALSDVEETKLLGLSAGAILLVSEAIDQDSAAQPISYALSRFPAERMELVV